MKQLIFIMIGIFFVLNAPNEHYIIIHGTWTNPFSWHMPGGDFHDALVQATDNLSVSFFMWSGGNSPGARFEAAERLVRMIEWNFKDTELTIVAHSHGANVANLASQMMVFQKYKPYPIARVFALGVPVNMSDYAPEMTVIKHYYNLFSFNDFVQPVFGIRGREFSPHERIANLEIHFGKKEPMHTELHDPIVARWLPKLPEILMQQQREKFEFGQPGIIYFYPDKPPKYKIDYARKEKQERDRMILMHLNNVMARNKQELD